MMKHHDIAATSPGCPNGDVARKILNDCVASLGIDVAIADRVGRFPSPTVLIDGVIVGQADAIALAEQVFGSLLSD